MPATNRIRSIDVVRGVVMVLMAIDHVRVYSGLPAGGPTPGIFFTRWVTHFCAPAFVFLAGTGAFLHGRSLADIRALSRFLLTRGLLLVLLELTVIRFGWTFNVDYSHFVLAGVIWMLGWCMVMLAGLVRLRTKTIGIIGVGMIVVQQLFGFVPRVVPHAMRPVFGWFWGFIYYGGGNSLPGISVLYVLVPWVGVMAAGYAFGTVVLRDPADRRRLCLRIGLGSTAVFVLVATLVAVLQAPGENAPPLLFRILNQQKYPPSQPFLLMTLGPTIALLPFAERARGWISGVFETFGRVPMFYYLLHIPLIHATALIVNILRLGHADAAAYATAPYSQVPRADVWSLPLLYLVFAIDVAALYAACRWYVRVKADRPRSWLAYI